MCTTPSSVSGVLQTGRHDLESPAQFENRIKPRMYVRRITHVRKSSILLDGTGLRKISSVPEFYGIAIAGVKELAHYVSNLSFIEVSWGVYSDDSFPVLSSVRHGYRASKISHI